MSVYECISVREIRTVPVIHKYGSQFIVIFRKCFCQIILIIRTFYDRVIDNSRLIKTDPSDGIRILLHKHIKIHAESFSVRIRRNSQIPDLIILFASGIVRYQHNHELIQGKDEHTDCGNQHYR